jgi:hypothetical protein
LKSIYVMFSILTIECEGHQQLRPNHASFFNTYLDVSMGDIVAVCILEALKDGPEDMSDLLLSHVDAIGV